MPIRVEPMLLPLLLAACGGVPEAPNAAEPVARATPSPTPAATIAPVSSVPDAITVTTNEPFYAAVVAGDAITLTGVSTSPRRLSVIDREVTADARRWRARDAAGEVVVAAARRPCSDDMSGAPRDFTGMLIVDGRTARGCAFAGKAPPPPPDEAAIPARFVGTWNTDAAACARPATSIEGLKVTSGELVFHESAGTVTGVKAIGHDKVEITADYEGEGERWTATQTLRLVGNRLTVAQRGTAFSRVRCPDRG